MKTILIYLATGAFAFSLSFSLHAAQVHDDDIVVERVETALKDFNPTSEIDVAVSVKKGVTTLEGIVENFPTKELATDTAATVRGVKAIINRLVVREQESDDKDITFSLERLFRLNYDNEDGAVDFKVNDGVVTLTGTISSYGVSYFAEEMAGSVSGVRSVTNLLRVEPLTKPSDEEIRQHLALLLESDPWISEELVTTTVEDGIVKIFGAVDTVSEKGRLVDTVGVYGVTKIDDSELYVAPELRTAAERAHEPLFRSDEDLANSIGTAFRQDPRLGGSSIEVEVVDQIATLTGTAKHIGAKTAANADAGNVPGILGVFDFVTIANNEGITDASLTTALEEVLSHDALLAGADIDVSVDNGHVVLDGKVETKYQRRRALKMCAHGSGVKRVTSKLRVDWDMPDEYVGNTDAEE